MVRIVALLVKHAQFHTPRSLFFSLLLDTKVKDEVKGKALLREMVGV